MFANEKPAKLGESDHSHLFEARFSSLAAYCNEKRTVFLANRENSPFCINIRLIFITGKKAQNVNKQVNKVKINVDDNHRNVSFRKSIAGKAIDVVNRKAKENENP